jgi:hypothetical protein
MNLYHRAVIAFCVVVICLGAALLIVTAVHGGGVVGFVAGGLFVLLGVARFTLERKRFH